MFEYFTNQAIAAIMLAQQEARRLGHSFVGTEQVLLGLLGDNNSKAAQILRAEGVTADQARAEVESIIGRGTGTVPSEIPLTPKTKRVLEQSLQEARNLGSSAVAPEHILLSLTRNNDSVAAKVMDNLGVDRNALRTKIIREFGDQAAAVTGAMRNPFGRSERSPRSTKALDEFGTDLTKAAAAGQLDPVVGREKEIERVVQILGRRSKNNPMLIGEPGVGKTAIAEGLAQRITDQDVPDLLQDKRVIVLDMALLVSGTRFRGDFEERLKQVMEEVRQSGNVILVIDEVHTLVGGGSMEGGMDAANLMKPALARGDLQCIGATTLDEYSKHIERDAALERRFQPVMVGEPSVEDTLDILRGVRGRYEQHHRLTISDEAIQAAATLSDRYISDRFLPDKAIDLIDEAGSRVRFRSSQNSLSKEIKQELRQVQQQKDDAVARQDFDKAGELRDREIELEVKLQAELQTTHGDGDVPVPVPVVTAEDIAQVVSAWTGVPVSRLSESESAMLMHLEATLHERVIGQDEAVTAVARSIRRARAGLKNLNRPIASLLFSGPTGVGKTELTKALAEAVFGSEDAMIRLDMSEFMERHTVSKLIGSPPGYVGYDEGGQLTEAVRRRPYTVVLFDEIEKAHPDVFNMMLQILEDGRLTDAKGRTVSFKDTLLVMTSNIGSRTIEKGGSGLGFETSFDSQAETAYQRIRDRVQDEMKQQFRPEFLNRLDDVIVFRQLTRDEVTQIADLLLQDINKRLAEQGITLQATEAFKDRLVVEGYDPSYGARPLRRAISRLVEDNLAEAMLRGDIQSGDTVVMDVDDDGGIQVRRENPKVLIGIGQS
ncbi:MAG: ATP-dependent Clp protease ATP-binding subunit [Synechococcales bacterium]|nr:ATP-dependent Clp protease ATP-binding subunit [Synechococcales bacterium]